MDKKFLGKVHVGIRRERQKNGDIYIFENKTAYVSELRKTKSLGQKLIGKIKSGSSEIIPTRPKRKKGEPKEIVSANRSKTTLVDILEWIGKSSRIDHDIHNAFQTGDAEKITSIARYWVATDGNTLPRIESWQNMHPMPYAHSISEDVYGKLFKDIGVNESGIQNYFKNRASILEVNPVIALDSTTISTYSENQIEARQGFNKDRDGLDKIKLLTLYSVKDKEPIAFAKQPGNIPDVISIDNAISQMQCFEVKKPLIVTDNGYYSEKNMLEFVTNNMKFLTLADSNITWIRNAIDSVKDNVDSMLGVCHFDINISGATTQIMHDFKRKRQRSRNGMNAGDTEVITKRLYVHVFYSMENANKSNIAFKSELLALKEQLEADITEFTPSAERKIKKYLITSRVGRGGKLNVTFNNEAYAQAKKYFGYFALVSNQAMDTFEALKNYRLREKIEELFSDQKGSFDGRRPRTWHAENLRGRMFVQFVGLGYQCFFSKKLDEVKQSLGVEDGKKSLAELNLEKKLLAWLKKHSLVQIFDWFDCIETTTIKTEGSERRWSTESIARDRLFLTKLGVFAES